MKIESVNCPNCGGSLVIANGMKQAYCQYCGTLLLISRTEEKKLSVPKTTSVDEDNPLYIKAIPVAAEKIFNAAFRRRPGPNHVASESFNANFITTISGVSYLTGSSYPVELWSDDWLVQDYTQTVKKTIFGEIKGAWKEQKSRSSLKSKELFEKLGVTYSVVKEERSETIEDWRNWRMRPQYPKDHYQPDSYILKRITTRYEYDTKILPKAIEKNENIRAILDRCRSNPHIQGFIESVLQNVPLESLNRRIDFEVGKEQVGMGILRIEDKRTVEANYTFKFHSSGLADCPDYSHRLAMLALLTAETLKRYGDVWLLESMDFQYDDYRADVCASIRGYQMYKYEKVYQEWGCREMIVFNHFSP